MNKIKSQCIIAVICCILFTTCFGLRIEERREGLYNNCIRVYIRYDTLEVSETASDADLDKKLKEIAAERYSSLMKEFIIRNVAENDRADAVSKITENMKKPKLIWRKEREDYAEAWVDFPIDSKLSEQYSRKYPDPPKRENDDEENGE